MRVALVDLPARHGIVSKDTVVGGYGSRLEPFSRVTRVVGMLKRRMHETPSVHLAYLGALLARHGHDVRWSRGELRDAELAIVVSSLVDYRHECAWADGARARGVKVGFFGLTASKLPELFDDHADFVVMGEPEAAICAGSHAGLRSRGDAPANRLPIWTRCRFRAGTSRDSRAAADGPCRSPDVHMAAAFRFWRAAAARSSARTARIASSRRTACVRSASIVGELDRTLRPV